MNTAARIANIRALIIASVNTPAALVEALFELSEIEALVATMAELDDQRAEQAVIRGEQAIIRAMQPRRRAKDMYRWN